ncbi:MAG TPA: proteasome subunit beta [Candidatus Nanoarchaeia archaeon]|nr:proteasome subunit beta [Candidatus Nanoarchaeia archaeon]
MEQNIKNRLTTGTTTIGIVCKDGIVLAADKRASGGYRIMDKNAEKIQVISDNIAVTTAGLVSDAQLLTKLIKAEIRLKKIRTDREITVKEASNLLAGMVYNNIRTPSMIQSIVGFLVAGKDPTGFHLYEIGMDGSIMTYDDFVSDGSGSDLAYGVLEAMYKKGISVNEGIQIALKSLNSAMQRDLPTGNGYDVVTITEKGVIKVISKKIEFNISN